MTDDAETRTRAVCAPTRGRAAVAAGLLMAAFVFSHFFRSAHAVLATDVAADIGVGADGLGLLSAAFFAGVAVMQIPVGVLFDHFGIRLIIPALMMLAVLGTWGVAAAPGLALMTGGWLLIGIGVSGIFSGALVAFSHWFPDRFTQLASLTVAIGGVGNIAAATPLSLASDMFGWRVAMAGVGVALLIAGALVVAVVPGGGMSNARSHDTRLKDIWRGLGGMLRNRDLQRLMPVAFVSYASLIAVRGLWAGPFLADRFGLDRVGQGDVVLAMAVAMIAGPMLYARLAGHGERQRRLIVAGGGVSVVFLLLFGFAPFTAVWQAGVVFALLGLAGCYFVLMFSYGRSLFQPEQVGRAVTVINFLCFAGVAVIQSITSWAMSLFPAETGMVAAEGYQLLSAGLSALVVLSLVPLLRRS